MGDARDPAIYLIRDETDDSVRACDLLKRSGRTFTPLQPTENERRSGSDIVPPALITPHGTWFGLSEIEAYLRIPPTSRSGVPA